MWAEKGEGLGRARARVGDGVRDARVELSRLSRGQDQIVVAEQQAQAAREHVYPLVALVGLQLRRVRGCVRREDLLERLDSAWPPGGL
jgi:hypothetical protein